jgi:small subunit ribosomal protein S17
MDKTVVVAITWHQPHPIYRKSVRRVTKAYAHDEHNTCRLGDLVQIEEARPLSRVKRWRVVDVLSQKDLPEVPPSALDEIIPGLETQAEPSAEISEDSVDSAEVDSPEEEEPSAEISEESVDSAEVDSPQEEEPSAEISEESVDSAEVDSPEEEQLEDESPSNEDEVSK